MVLNVRHAKIIPQVFCLFILFVYFLFIEAAVAQEIEQAVREWEDWRFDTWLLQSARLSVLGQDTESRIAHDDMTSPVCLQLPKNICKNSKLVSLSKNSDVVTLNNSQSSFM